MHGEKKRSNIFGHINIFDCSVTDDCLNWIFGIFVVVDLKM